MRSATLVETYADLERFFQWLGNQRGCLGVDTETTGLRWWEPNFCRLLTVANNEDAWAIPMDRWPGAAMELEKYSGDIVMHNAKFDLHALGWHRKVHDTMLMSHLLDPRPPHGLKELGVRHVENKANWYQRQLDQDMKDNKWDWATVPVNWPAYWQYGAYDPWLTLQLYDRYWPELRTSTLYDLELEFMQVIRRVEERGMRVDREYALRQVNIASNRCHDINEELAAKWGIGEEGPGSNPAVSDCLLLNGVALHHRTPNGAISVREDVLSDIDHPISRLVLEYRGLIKRSGSWFRPFLKDGDGEILHPDIRTVGARTGRLSVSRPAMQTLPRGALVRDAVIARDDHSLILCDYAQAELRILAHFANDKNMIAAFVNGEDLHQQLADTAGCPRQVAKNAWFAKCYGAGIPKFSETAGISEEEGAAIYAAIDARFPGIRRLMKSIENTSADRLVSDGEAWVRTPWGRYQPADLGYEYKLTNALVQATATADLPKEKIVILDACGWGEFIILPVHDEVMLDTPDELLAEALVEVPKLMEEHEKFKVPMTVETTVVKRWGDKYRVEEKRR